jgi:5-methylcytosine-specific restriction endonuclease McrA
MAVSIQVSESDKQQMIQMRANGKTGKEIAREFGLSQSWVCYKLKEWGAPKAKHYRQVVLSSEVKKKVISMYQSGMSVHAVGDRIGRSGDFVHERLKKWGIPLRPPANKLSGADSYCWKDHLTEEDRENNRNYIYHWAKAVIKRDGEKCKLCNREGKLTAHHLFCYAEYPELRVDINNGITLCHKCHYDFHINFMGGWTKPCTPIDMLNYIMTGRLKNV